MSGLATTRALLVELHRRGLVPLDLATDASPAQERAREAIRALGDDPPPWFVRALVGAGTWIGAVFLAFVPMMLGAFRTEPARGVLGAILVASAAALSRAVPPAARGVFLGQVTLIGASAGGLLAAIAFLGPLFHSRQEMFFASCVVVAAAVTALVRDAVVRFLGAGIGLVAAISLVIELGWPLGPHGPAALAVGLVIAAFALDAPLAVRGLLELTRPVAFGLALAALGAAQLPPESWHQGALTSDREAMVTASVAQGLLCALATALALGERGAGIASPAGGVALLAVAAATGATLGTPAVPASLAVIAIARLRGEPILHGMGLTGLAVALVLFFADERRGSWSERGLSLSGLGVVLLVARAVLARAFMSADAAEAIEVGEEVVSSTSTSTRARARGIRAAAFLGATALTLAIVAAMAFTWEAAR